MPQDPWIYFLTGALIPTIALFLLDKKKPKFHSGDERIEDEDLRGVLVGGPSSNWTAKDAPYKMVLVVNTTLKMGKGKIAAQVGHAAVACYKRASKQCPVGLAAWERTGCAKIAVKCDSEQEMEEIAVAALSRDLPCYLVEDAGRTQIAAGSRTVLGIGPAPVYAFEGVTSHLKLM
eukprot:CAMPEP_0178902988 /NCGR_PEP_ID=MMETSP0786-20121207/4911_1 /TAXON_ID=186022 /ORGANISM="Thalassionema frauenfeldii, Strain CCMP 1798" /LENGTH=175 /DNA_ID=CAMNT_0020574317 /DNA_START=74 /DNA_END=601 /DNA_ORIENTATION=-